MKRQNIILLIIIIVMIGALCFFLLPKAHKATSEDQTLPVVAVAVAKRENLASSITLSAEFRPYEETDLHAKVAGYLKNINVDIGDQVKAGQVIATLDIAELKADYARTEADYRNAKLDYDRVSEVIRRKPGLLAQADVDKSEANYGVAKANLEHAKTFFDYATITAPFDGVITKRYVDPGALIQASTNSSTQTLPLVHVAENTRLRLDFPVPEAAVPQVHAGTEVKITIQATGQTIKSQVARISGKIDSATRTMNTEVDVDNKDLRITPGMYASVTIDLDQKNDVLTLPVQAVAFGDKPDVWLINAANQVEDKPITLGLQTPDKVEILSGLNAGDKAVFGSRATLHLGMKVNPQPVKEK